MGDISKCGAQPRSLEPLFLVAVSPMFPISQLRHFRQTFLTRHLSEACKALRPWVKLVRVSSLQQKTAMGAHSSRNPPAQPLLARETQTRSPSNSELGVHQRGCSLRTPNPSSQRCFALIWKVAWSQVSFILCMEVRTRRGCEAHIRSSQICDASLLAAVKAGYKLGDLAALSIHIILTLSYGNAFSGERAGSSPCL